MKLTWLPHEMSLNPVAAGLLCSALFGCDDRPISAYAALPPPGERLPAFEAPLVRGGLFSSAAGRGTPTLLALWSTSCSHSLRIRSTLDSLATAYPDDEVRILILADDALEELEQYVDTSGTRVPMVALNGRLQELFDRSRGAPERDSLRVKFALPSFLLLDAEGVVQSRVGGADMERVVSLVEALQSKSSDPGH